MSGRTIATAVVAVALLIFAGLHVHSVAFEDTRPSLILVSLIFTALGLAHAIYTLGWRHALGFFALCAVLSGLLEQIAISTGNIGGYSYTEVLGPKIGDVPIIIPVSWFMMIYPSYVIANLLVDGRPVAAPRSLLHLLWLSLITAVVQTAWDLSLDPFMVHEMQAWKWDDAGAYFSIPIENYFGWMQVTLLVVVPYRLWEWRLPPRSLGPPSRWLVVVPLVVYALNGLTDVLVGYEDTRLLPPFVMGIPLLLAASRLRRWQGGTDEKGEER